MRNNLKKTVQNELFHGVLFDFQHDFRVISNATVFHRRIRPANDIREVQLKLRKNQTFKDFNEISNDDHFRVIAAILISLNVSIVFIFFSIFHSENKEMQTNHWEAICQFADFHLYSVLLSHSVQNLVVSEIELSHKIINEN